MVALEEALGEGEVALAILRGDDGLLLYEVARTGQFLYESAPGAFLNFFSYASRRLQDTEKFRSAVRGWLEARLARRGVPSAVRARTGPVGHVRRRTVIAGRRLAGGLAREHGATRDRTPGSVLVEVATDINGIIAASKGLRPPATARESFIAVRDAGILDSRLAERFIASYVGLQDRIVHDCDTLDVGLTVRAAARLLEDAAEFGRQVRRGLDAPGTAVTNGGTGPPARRS